MWGQLYSILTFTHQGDPISPYLFITALEVLLALIKSQIKVLKFFIVDFCVQHMQITQHPFLGLATQLKI